MCDVKVNLYNQLVMHEKLVRWVEFEFIQGVYFVTGPIIAEWMESSGTLYEQWCPPSLCCPVMKETLYH